MDEEAVVPAVEDLDALPAQLREEFPYLQMQGRGGKPIAYFDSGATTQKPQRVTDAMVRFYSNQNGAINRGTHLLADTATELYEDARTVVADFFRVSPAEIVWTSGATDALNQVALACVLCSVGNTADAASPFYCDSTHSIVVTRAEHHANLLPWQQLAAITGAQLRWLELQPDGTIDPQSYSVIDESTRIVAFQHMSNVTGAITDVTAIAAAATGVGALTILDTCQSVAHMPVSFASLGVDFCVASAHKMYGPTGIGCLWGRSELLERMPPVRRGGSMIVDVTMEASEFLPPPARFEAGTQAVAQIIGWAEALRFLSEIGMARIAMREQQLGSELVAQFAEIPQLHLLGSHDGGAHHGVVSFTLAGIHPHDVGQILDSVDVAVRVGHHCAIPLHRFFGVASSTRATLSVTTTRAEVQRLVDAVGLAIGFFKS